METGMYKPLHGDVWIEENSPLVGNGSSGLWAFDVYQWVYQKAITPGAGPDDQVYQKIHEDGKGNSYWRKKTWRHIHP